MSPRILRFSFTNEKVTELLSVGRIKLDVSPFEYECLAQTQSRFEKQNGYFLRRLWGSLQIELLLLMRENKVTTPLTLEHLDPGHRGNLIPVVR